MRVFIVILILNMGLICPVFATEESYYQNKIDQLKILNNNLRDKLLSSIDEINQLKTENANLKESNATMAELEKTKKELANKAYEIRQLRAKMMIAADEEYSADKAD